MISQNIAPAKNPLPMGLGLELTSTFDLFEEPDPRRD